LKKTSRTAYQDCKQGLYQSLVSYREEFDAAYESYKDQENVKLPDEVVAMDFFKGMGPHFSDFNAENINSITCGAIEEPKNLNEV
jgi:hypothetical protein